MLKRFCLDMKKYRKYIAYAGMTELKTEVADSYLNWLWWIIEPICFMFVYTLVFGIIFNSKIEHFNVFVYIGITMWDFFNRVVNSSVKLVRNNKSVISKVYLPKYVLIFIKMYVNGFKMLISLGVMFVMILVSGISISWTVFWIFPVILVMMVFTFGISALLLHFGVYIDDLAKVITIVLRIMFYLTGVFYDLSARLTSSMGEKVAKTVIHVNPMATAITAMRDAVFYKQMPELRYLLIWFIIGLLMSIFGVWQIYRSENNYVKVI